MRISHISNESNAAMSTSILLVEKCLSSLHSRSQRARESNAVDFSKSYNHSSTQIFLNKFQSQNHRIQQQT